MKGRRRPCVGLETWIFRSNSGGLLEIMGMCQAGPRYPHEDHHEAVACTGCETSDGLDGEVEWKEEG